MPFSVSRRLWDSFVQKGHRQPADLGAFIVEDQFGIVGAVVSQVARFDVLGGTEIQHRLHVLGRHGQHHALLRLADPDFRVVEPVVFERGVFEPNAGAELFAHLTDGAGKTARPAVGDRMVQTAGGVIAGLKDHVEHLLLGDGVADLHGV